MLLENSRDWYGTTEAELPHGAKLAAAGFEARGVPVRTGAIDDPASLDEIRRALARGPEQGG